MQNENHPVYGWFHPNTVYRHMAALTRLKSCHVRRNGGEHKEQNALQLTKVSSILVNIKRRVVLNITRGIIISGPKKFTPICLWHTHYSPKKRHCFLAISEILLSFHDSHVITALGI